MEQNGWWRKRKQKVVTQGNLGKQQKVIKGKECVVMVVVRRWIK